MTTAFHNSSVRSNVLTSTTENVIAPQGRRRDREQPAEVKIPIGGVKSMDYSNKPTHHVESYTANQKTMVQNMFNKRNLNENLNFKNTFYLEERGELANKEANTIYGHDKVYRENVVEAELKAQYAAKVWQSQHVENVNKVKQGFQKTANTVAQKRDDKAKLDQKELTRHQKDVKKLFKKVQNVVGKMVGTIAHDVQEKSSTEPNTEEHRNILAYNIQKNATDKETTLNNRGNIRNLMGARSAENQEKIQAEKDAQEKLEAEEDEKKLRLIRQEEAKLAKYMNLQELSKRWRIYDKTKLKETVRNEIMKEVLKEEERKNFEKIAEILRKSAVVETVKKSASPKKEKNLLEPPKAFNAAESGKKKKRSKKYKFAPSKVVKHAKETQEDFKTRFTFAVMALPKQKAMIDPVQRHKITKDFQEMVIRNGLEKNGRLTVE